MILTTNDILQTTKFSLYKFFKGRIVLKNKLILIFFVALSNYKSFAEVDFNTGTGLMLGTGYDSVAGDSRGDCVTYSLVKDSGPALARKMFTIRIIEERSQLSTLLGLDVAASLRGAIGSGTLKSNFISNYSFNNYSVYILAQAKFLKAIEKIYEPKIRDEYLVLAKNDLSYFKESCGDKFVASVQQGSEVWAILKINTGSTEEMEAIKADLSAQGGSWDTDFNFVSMIKKVTENRSVEIYFEQVGANESEFPMTIDGLIAFIKEFSKNANGTATPLYANVTDYTTLSEYPREELNPIKKIIAADLDYLNERRNELILWKTNIDYIMGHKDEFESFDFESFKKLYQQVNSSLRKINQTLRTCFNNLMSCELTDNQLILLDLPKRKSNLPPLGCILASDLICGIKSYKLTENVNCPDPTYKEAKGPQCGEPVSYNKSRHEACGAHPGCVDAVRKASIVFGAPTISVAAAKDICLARADYDTCPKPEFGIAHDNLCRHQNFGVEVYKECIDYSLPIFPACRHYSNGIEKYGKCRHPENGIEEFHSCLIQKNRTNGLRKCPFINE